MKQTNKTQYIIIAGPQAAGKSTTMEYLKNKYSSEKILFFKETRTLIKRDYNPGGCLTATRNLELKTIEEDLKRLKTIEEKSEETDNSVYVDETSIFTLAHALLYDIRTEGAFKKYITLLKKLNTKIIFLDISPEISWNRRKGKYEKRIENMDKDEKKNAMKNFKKYISFVHPNLINMFKKIDLPKIRLYSELDLNDSLRNSERMFLNLIQGAC